MMQIIDHKQIVRETFREVVRCLPRSRRELTCLRWLLLILGWVSCSYQLALAEEDFAIRTGIYAGDDESPVSQNLTVFHDGKIYDFFDTAPQGVTVFDTKTLNFVLARRDRRVLTKLSADELIHFAAAEQAHAETSDNKLVRFAANPKFKESFDADQMRLSLTSPLWDYHVDTLRLEDQAIMRRYAEFAHWYTHLNALFRPLPPAIRLELNRVLDQHGCLPQRVVVQIKRGDRVVVEQQSRHELITTVGDSELSRIDDWEREQVGYRTVDFAAYRAASKNESKGR